MGDDDGAAWPITGRRCLICQLPALDENPHPTCRPSGGPAATDHRAAVQQVAGALGGETVSYYTTRWLVSGAALPTPPSTPAKEPR